MAGIDFLQQLMRVFPNFQQHLSDTFGPQVAQSVAQAGGPVGGAPKMPGPATPVAAGGLAGAVTTPTGPTPAPAQTIPNPPTRNMPGAPTFGGALGGALGTPAALPSMIANSGMRRK